MSLGSALATTMAGLQANQAALSIISANIANSQTPGYVAETINQVETYSGSAGPSVQVLGVNRSINQFIQSQLRTETSGGAYADQMAGVLTQLQSVYGTPGATGSLESAYSNFTSALQSLSTTSGSSSSQISAMTAAQSLAQQLNATSQGIQTLRSNAEQDIGTSVTQANADLATVAQINSQLQGLSSTDPLAATLADQRDSAINDLSKLMDVSITNGSNNQTSVYTSNGIQLVGAQAATLSFNSQGTLNPNSTGGTISATLPNGSSVDLLANNAITSGQIGADLTLRNTTLVQAQAQVDQLAASIASALSNKTTVGTSTTSGTQNGFTVDTSNLQPGNTINFSYTDPSNIAHNVTVIAVNNTTPLPLSNVGVNPTNPVIGVNLSGSIASQLSLVGLQFSQTGSTLSILNANGSSAKVNSASITTTATQTANGNPQLALFTDGNALYTGAVTSAGTPQTAYATQQTGYAGRITVNSAVVANPALLTNYSTSPPTQAGDTTRSDYLYSQLTSSTFNYSPQTGLGTATAPLNGTISNYLNQFLSLQGNASTAATQLQQGQDVVVNALQQKVQSTSGVNLDTEMSNLIAIQNNYAASAHVMSVVQTMMNTLLQAQV